MIANPEYKVRSPETQNQLSLRGRGALTLRSGGAQGKWACPQVDNPEYKGQWAPAQVMFRAPPLFGC